MVTKEQQTKHWASKDLRIIQSYWDSPPATKRSKWLVEQLRGYDFDSIFEVGFFAGRNLRYIAEAFSQATVGGLEVNPKAVKFAQGKLPEADLYHKDLHDIADISSTFDIVFTSGVLIHVPPTELEGVLGKLVSKANKHIMHIEEIGENTLVAGPKHMAPSKKESGQIQWAPDLPTIYRDLGYEPEVIPLPDECKTNGAAELVVVKL